MSHLHIPDGVISPFWLAVGFIGMAVLLALAINRAGKADMGNKVSRVGIFSAFMLLAMSIPLGFLPMHLNLTVLAGIFLGPWLGVIAVFVVNFILALLGHGGITVLGFNTLILGSEVLLGYYVFMMLRSRIRVTQAASAATVMALTVSLCLMLAVVGFTQVDPALAFHNHQHNSEKEQQAVAIVQNEISGDKQSLGEEETTPEGSPFGEHISLARFALIILPFAAVGIALETVIITLIIGYIFKIRPDLISRPE